MAPSLHVALSMSLTMGIPLVWAIRELVVLRRGRGGSLRGAADATPEPRPLPSGLVPPDYALRKVTRRLENV